MLLPVYEADFDPLLDKYDGIMCVSLVKQPAIESDFVKLAHTEKLEIMSFNKKKKVVCGAVLIPDKLIYRNNGEEEYFIKFSAQCISDLHRSMMKNNMFGQFSLDHNGIPLNGELYPTEVWIKEFEQDKSNAYGLNLPVGTLFMSAKVQDDLLWDKIEAGEFNGFSIEAFLNYKYTNMEKFLFNKIELGEQVVKQVGESIEFKFSGEFENEGSKVVVEDGFIKEIVSLEEETPVVEAEVESPSEIDKVLAEIEQFKEVIQSIKGELDGVKETLSKDEKYQTLLNKVEEIKLASAQVNPLVVEPQAETKLSRLDIIEKLGKTKY